MQFKFGTFKKEYIFICLLLVATLLICYFAFFTSWHGKYLKVAFLDVGQGDAIYVEAPNGKQMLIDAGKDARILAKLAKVMPFGDRSIDLIVITNPDEDHIGGFISVLDQFDVKMVIEPGTISETLVYKTLKEKIDKEKAQKILARAGMKILLEKEKNIYFDILFPDRDVSGFERNDGSVVGRLAYGEKSFMLMGDATIYTEILISQNKSSGILKSDILKLGHHGSRTSSSNLWLERVMPNYAIISAGKNNRYGHPHKEVLDRLNNLHIPYLGTYEKGTIVFETDGKNLIY